MAWLRKNLLLLGTISSVLLGALLGFILRPWNLEPQTIMLLSFPGEILMHMLKMMILPLIISSLISGLAQLDAKQSGRMGSLAILYYVVTTVIAVIASFTGIFLVLSIHPGDPTIKQDLGEGTEGKTVSTLDTFLDLIRNMFPENIVQATFQQVQTKYEPIKPKILKKNTTDMMLAFSNSSMSIMRPSVEYTAGMNVLGDNSATAKRIIAKRRATGVSVDEVKKTTGDDHLKYEIHHSYVNSRGGGKCIKDLIMYSPFGIMCLIMGKILEIHDLADTARMLAMYMVTVLSATLPMTFRCLEENLGVDRRVTRFVLPVGATINMDGTALYEAVAAIFIAQMNGINLSFGQVVTVSLTATLASIGAASVPSAGLVTMLLVLTAVGLPVKDVSLIVAVDWLLDRIRTSINVIGDAFGAGIVHYYSQEKLALLDAEHRLVQQMHDEHDEYKSVRVGCCDIVPKRFFVFRCSNVNVVVVDAGDSEKESGICGAIREVDTLEFFRWYEAAGIVQIMKDDQQSCD
ncbi:Excitatory amino acid transporter [Toxocara canis]|uniref:Amino acid transporter n=1 Tax=Toxocara canis TaxID=6265 RepID=A0A0B2VSA3_TOXCA|nr:Excitatory amino acid transporter [Toxocara canis]